MAHRTELLIIDAQNHVCGLPDRWCAGDPVTGFEAQAVGCLAAMQRLGVRCLPQAQARAASADNH